LPSYDFVEFRARLPLSLSYLEKHKSLSHHFCHPFTMNSKAIVQISGCKNPSCRYRSTVSWEVGSPWPSLYLRESDRVCWVRPWKSLRDLGFKLAIISHGHQIWQIQHEYPPDYAKIRGSDSCRCVAAVLVFAYPALVSSQSYPTDVVGMLCPGSTRCLVDIIYILAS
jgi:hypothetical protein